MTSSISFTFRFFFKKQGGPPVAPLPNRNFSEPRETRKSAPWHNAAPTGSPQPPLPSASPVMYPPPPPHHMMAAARASAKTSIPAPSMLPQAPAGTTTSTVKKSGTVIVKKVLPKVLIPPGLQAKAAAAAAARGEVLAPPPPPASSKRPPPMQKQTKSGILGVGTESCNEASQMLKKRVADHTAIKVPDHNLRFTKNGVIDKSTFFKFHVDKSIIFRTSYHTFNYS